MPKNRFDMEQEILDCWHVTDDIDVLMEAVMEKDLSTDNIVNVLLGMKDLYHLKFQRLFDTFEQCIKEDAFKTSHITFPESSEDITVKFDNMNTGPF